MPDKGKGRMANIRKRNDMWVAEVRVKSTRRSKSFGTKAEAQRWALDLEHQLGRDPGVSISHSFREAMQRYLKEVSPTRKGLRWEEIRINKLSRDKLADIMLADLRVYDFQDWINRQTFGPASINRELNLMSAVLREARVHWKWLSDNPMRDLKRPKQPPGRDRILNDKELERLLEALEYDEAMPVITMRQEIAVALLLALETAMRRGELLSLDWQYIYLEKNFLTLLETKNGTKRDVPLTPRACALFKKLRPQNKGKVFNTRPATMEVVFRRAVKMASIKGFTFHDSRHTAITRLARKLDVLDLARMVGHRDIRSLQIYYNPTAQDIAARLAA